MLMLQTIEHKLEEQSRVLMAWVRGAVYTTEKQADLVWLLRAVLETLELASQQGELFAFVPDFYLETMVELCSALRCYFSPTLPLEELAGKKDSGFNNRMLSQHIDGFSVVLYPPPQDSSPR